jgi:hypothetical protein
MNLKFLIIGAIIFAIYLALMIWNILYSSKKQQEENYPNIKANKPTISEDKPESDSQ